MDGVIIVRITNFGTHQVVVENERKARFVTPVPVRQREVPVSGHGLHGVFEHQ